MAMAAVMMAPGRNRLLLFPLSAVVSIQLNVACAPPLMGTFRHRKRFFRLVNCFKGPRKWRQYRGCYYLKTPCETIRRPHPLLRATTNNGKEMTTVSRRSYTQIGK